MKIDTRKSYVYAHVVNGKIVYIGAGHAGRPYEFKHRRSSWKEAVERSAGVIQVRILGTFALRSDALDLERTLVKKHRPECNLVHNGWVNPAALVGHPHTEETKRKIGLSHIGYKHGLAAKKKMSDANRGRVHTEESRRNMGLAQLGRVSAMKGRKHSSASIEKMREAHRGKFPTLATRKKLSEARARYWRLRRGASR